VTEIAGLFEQNGLRWTIQRQLVLQIIQQHSGHLSVDDIYSQVNSIFPSVNRSTVYRTLELLKELAVIVEVQGLDNLLRYELVQNNPHYHALCEKCGHEYEIDNTLIAQLREDILRLYQLKLNIAHFVGVGTCSHCA
jgi:Fur family ferric uptake transcriptional regulator